MEEEFDALRHQYLELRKKYDADQEELRFLLCLIQAGVKTWEGYSRAEEIFEEGLLGAHDNDNF